MTENKKDLTKLFEGFYPGATIRLDAEVNGVHLEGPYVFVGNCKAGIKCVKAELVDNKIIYANSAITIKNAKQIHSVAEIPPLLEYFSLQ